MKFTRRDVTRLLALPVIFHATKIAITPAYASLTKDPAFRERLLKCIARICGNAAIAWKTKSMPRNILPVMAMRSRTCLRGKQCMPPLL